MSSESKPVPAQEGAAPKAPRKPASPNLRDTDGLARVPARVGSGDPWGETEEQHRALLLYAMQDPGQRSLRAAASAAGVSDGAIRNWGLRWGWEARIARESRVDADGHEDRTLQDKARAMYAGLYLAADGMVRVQALGARMTVPLVSRVETAEPLPAQVAEVVPRADVAPSQLPEDGKLPVQQASTVMGRAQRGMEVVLASFFQRLSTAEGRASVAKNIKVSELTKLIDAYQKIAAQIRAGSAPGAQVAELTFRVQQAMATGSSVEDAMLEDAEELVAIHRALREKRLRAEEEAEIVRLAKVGAAAVAGGAS